jgi:hypothetical protein
VGIYPPPGDTAALTASGGGDSTDFGTSLRARILAGLFAAGATLALLTVVLPIRREPARSDCC